MKTPELFVDFLPQDSGLEEARKAASVVDGLTASMSILRALGEYRRAFPGATIRVVPGGVFATKIEVLPV